MNNKNRLHILSNQYLFVLLILALFTVLSACAPATTEEAVAQPTDYTLFLNDSFLGDEFYPLDRETLNAIEETPSPRPGFYTTSDGVSIELQYDKGPQVRDAGQIWIVVTNHRSGEELARFNPPEPGFISGFSADGSKLFWQPDLPYDAYPPPIDWLVLDAEDGQVLAHIEDETNACFRQWALFSPDGRFVYCAVDPALEDLNQPAPLRIAVYDVAGESLAAEVEVPNVRIGGEPATHDDVQIYEFLEPALLLSPDRTYLTVYDAAEETITLINTTDLAIEESFSLNNSVAFLDLFSNVAQAKGMMDGVIGNGKYSLDGSQLYLFNQVLRPNPEDPPGDQGLRLVDIEKKSVLAEALTDYLVQWLYPAPDGTLFVFGSAAEHMMPFEIRDDVPSTLWRLDGQTLEVLAQRDFDGYRAGRIIYTN